MKNAILILLGLLVLALLFYLAFHSHAVLESTLPPRIVCVSKANALAQAGPQAIPVLGTGSMDPFIPHAAIGGDPVTAFAVASTVGYESIKVGTLCIYRASWTTPPGQPVMHQAAVKDASGWVMSGLNNLYSETSWRMTSSNFVAIVDRVYVWTTP